jgi:hypothetical protein
MRHARARLMLRQGAQRRRRCAIIPFGLLVKTHCTDIDETIPMVR